MFKQSKWIRGVSVGLILGLVFLTAAPMLDAAVCEDALKKCLLDALMSTIFPFNLIQLALSAGNCTMGYQFCLLYYESAQY